MPQKEVQALSSENHNSCTSEIYHSSLFHCSQFSLLVFYLEKTGGAESKSYRYKFSIQANFCSENSL